MSKTIYDLLSQAQKETAFECNQNSLILWRSIVDILKKEHDVGATDSILSKLPHGVEFIFAPSVASMKINACTGIVSYDGISPLVTHVTAQYNHCPSCQVAYMIREAKDIKSPDLHRALCDCCPVNEWRNSEVKQCWHSNSAFYKCSIAIIKFRQKKLTLEQARVEVLSHASAILAVLENNVDPLYFG